MQKGSSTISYKIFGTDSSSGGIVHRGWGLIAIFRNSFASTSETFILPGVWALGYHSMGFRNFPNIS